MGKTYLVDETFKGRIVFRHAGLLPFDENEKGMLKAQLEHFYYSYYFTMNIVVYFLM